MGIGNTLTYGIDKQVNVQGSPSQFQIATPGTDGASFAVANGSAAPLVGIFETTPNRALPQARLRLSGISMCIAGAPIALGNFITSDGNGNGVQAQPAANVNAYVIGVALDSAQTGQPFPVLVMPQRIQG